MLRVLFVYSKCNTSVSYKQGMHEILAPIIFVLNQEKTTHKKNDTQDAFSYIFSEHFVEHDSFTLFTFLMKNLKDWFLYGTTPVCVIIFIFIFIVYVYLYRNQKKKKVLLKKIMKMKTYVFQL